MESVFLRFHSYDFAADRRFQDGLKSSHETGRDTTRLLDLKLFFYNRFIEPIDWSGYKQWMSASPHVTLSDSDISKKQTAETSAEAETKQLSFAEVMRLVQEGKEVPGVTKLDVKPTNQSPTPSQMGRILKPWEISPDSK